MLVTRNRLILALLATGFLCPFFALPTTAAVASAASDDQTLPNSLPQDIISSRTAITPAQKERIEDFADKLTEVIREDAGNSSKSLKARDLLIQTTRLAGVTPVFLRTYSEIVISRISPIVFGDDAVKSENALRVVAFLQTPQAVGILVESLDPKRSEDTSRRLVAAGLLPIAIAPGSKSNLDSASLTSTARNVALNARTESDWVVVLEELRGLNQIALNSKLSDQNRADVRTVQFETYKAIADRIAGDDSPSDMIFALHRAMLGLRTQLINNSTAADFDSKRVATLLESILTQIAKASVKQWTSLEKDPKHMDAYEASLKIGTQLLSLLKSDAAPAFATLSPAFGKGRDALQTAVSKLP